FFGEGRAAARNVRQGARRGKEPGKIARTVAWFRPRGGRDNWDLPGRGASQGCAGVLDRRRLRWRILLVLQTPMGKTRSPGQIVGGDRFPVGRLWLGKNLWVKLREVPRRRRWLRRRLLRRGA